MADGNSDSFLGVIVGALLLGVIGFGGFLFLSHQPGPSTPAASVSLSVVSSASASTNH